MSSGTVVRRHIGGHRTRRMAQFPLVKTQPTGDRPRYLIVVAPDRPDLLQYLARQFAEDKWVEIVLDRRRRDLPRGQSPEPELAFDRRHRPLNPIDFPSRSFLIVPRPTVAQESASVY
jgi:hypothetical protein